MCAYRLADIISGACSSEPELKACTREGDYEDRYSPFSAHALGILQNSKSYYHNDHNNSAYSCSHCTVVVDSFSFFFLVSQ
jgi:hypothetical protein